MEGGPDTHLGSRRSNGGEDTDQRKLSDGTADLSVMDNYARGRKVEKTV